jgi:predicted permease
VARNLRARRWRAGLVVALLAVAMAANALVFSAADSLVFRRLPYADAERLIQFNGRDARTGRPGYYSGGPAALDEWRKQTDLFAGVHGYAQRVIFLTAQGEPELVRAVDVTPGLIELLGEYPRWGRSFIEGEERQTTPQPVLIAESLARERFGDPARAVNQPLPTTAEALMVVGVMPDSFRFPSYTRRIWRAVDSREVLARGQGMTLIGRIAAAMPLDAVPGVMEQRSAAIAAAVGADAAAVAVPTPLPGANASSDRRRMLLVLLGAALCLLLIACANVASLELASTIGRARSYAIQIAIGASRSALARTAMLEGACLVGASTVAAAVFAYAGAEALVRYMPPALIAGTANPIDVDERALLFMVGVAAATWLLSTLPVAAFAWRADLIDILKLEGATAAASPRGTFLRRALTAGQVAAAVLLLVGSVAYVRSYVAVLALDKGFESSGVVAISLTIPPQLLASGHERRALADRILERVRSRPGVIAAFEGSPPPTTGDATPIAEQLEVDDRPPVETDLRFPRLWVTPDYFKVLQIPLLDGRMFELGDPPTNVIITETLARRLWPNGSAVGRRFREHPTESWKHVIGVVGHVRALADGTSGPGREFQTYVARQPPPRAAAPPTRPRSNMSGPVFRSLTITARVDSRDRTADLFQTVRSVDTRNILTLEFLDDLYALEHADRLLATRIISGFGLLAFLIATAGIYGLMTFLVAERTREIGIRMALGAGKADIRRLVIGSSAKLVGTGAVVGIAATIAASRWIQSQLYGVRALDPLAIGAVATGVVVVALLATWRPARQATKVDPTLLLRG